jgi:hypothetical protein
VVLRAAIPVAILADQRLLVVLAVVLKLVVAVQLLAAALKQLVLLAVILAAVLKPVVAVQLLAVVLKLVVAVQLLAAALKQLVLQLRATADVERRSLAASSRNYSAAKLRSLVMKPHVMLVQHLAALARLQQQLQQKPLQQQHQLQLWIQVLT